MKGRALVTGAAGFIGSNVVGALLDAGYEVRAMHLAREDTRNLRGLDVERVAGDVTDEASVRDAVRGCELVFHLAAVYTLWTPDVGHMRRVNVGGTKNVLRAARASSSVRRVVYTSSIARFGGQGPGARATEASPFALGRTGDRYAQSKADAHEVAALAAREHDVVIVAPCGPIGPGDVGPTPTGRLLLAALRMPVAFVPPSATCFADVRDMARAHVLAAERGVRGESYLLGCRDLTLAEIARMAMDAVGVDKPIVVAPLPLASAAGHALSFVADHVTRRAPLFTAEAVRIARLELRADCTKAVRELGMPQSPIDRAVADAVEWFLREGYVSGRRRAA